MTEYPSISLPPLSSGIPNSGSRHEQHQAQTQAHAVAIVDDWASRFNTLLRDVHLPQFANLFHPEAWLRDTLTLTWDYRTLKGRHNIVQHIKDNQSTVKIENVTPSRLGDGKAFPPQVVRPAPGLEWVQSMFTFETTVGFGKGLVRLVAGRDGQWQIYLISFILQELTRFPESTGRNRPYGGSNSTTDPHAGEGAAWKEFREKQQKFLNENPTCLIVGAGHSGLDLAARLNQLGVSNLVIDKNPRVGDNWRTRYKSLVLHDPVHLCHMPYLPFPPSWPLFTPKDKLADWFEAYAGLMDLNIWMGTSVRQARYSEDTKSWTVHLKFADGGTRILKPKHFVMATGHSGEPRMPWFPGQEYFGGTVYHTSQHQDAALFGDLSGKQVVVVGSGNSGHDIAQNFSENNAQVTILQRSPTVVVGVEKGTLPTVKGLYDDNSPPTEDADVFLFSYPWPVKFFLDAFDTTTYRKAEQPLLDELTKAGFALRYGHGGEGLYKQYITQGGGYYIDVGCSKLIAKGQIKVRRSEGGIQGFDREGLVLADGSKLFADIVVMATGYDSMKSTARKIVGDKIADRLKEVWGLDEEGEMNAMWRYSGHPNFWFMGGNFLLCRFYSRLLAMQIKACEEGLYRRPAK